MRPGGEFFTSVTRDRAKLRRLRPRVKSPSPKVVRQLTAEDREILDRRLTETVECIFHRCFQRTIAEQELMNQLPEAVAAPRRRKFVRPPADGDFFTIPATATLTSEQERHLFMRFNYCRHRVMRILRHYQGRRLPLAGARELVEWERKANDARGEIARANMPLVLAMVKRSRAAGVDPGDLVGEGNLALIRSVDRFDYSRGFKFSTYACRAILTSFSRASMRSLRYRSRFPTEFDPELEKSDFIERKREHDEEALVENLKQVLDRNLANLSKVELRVIRERFALGVEREDATPTRTLHEVAAVIGVTKERVRQIQNKALHKLRGVMEQRALAG